MTAPPSDSHADEEFEDATDRRELQAARDDADYVPWEEVKAELGLG